MREGPQPRPLDRWRHYADELLCICLRGSERGDRDRPARAVPHLGQRQRYAVLA
jgi:hypothetical protein